MSDDPVLDDELLYRSILFDEVTFSQGILHISSEAFGDRQCRVSVDRATFRSPQETQKRDSDYVAGLIAGEIRAQRYGDKQYGMDVLPDPWPATDPGNPAHAVVVPDPADASKNFRAKKMRELLSRLAEKRIIVTPNSKKNF